MAAQYRQNDSERALKETKDVKHTTIVLAIEQIAFREDLKSLLDSEPYLHVVGRVNNGLDALDMVGKLQPDVLVYGLNGNDNQEIIRIVNLRNPKTTVFVLPNTGKERGALELLGSRAKAHILKRLDGKELVEAIRCMNANKDKLSSPSLEPAGLSQTRNVAEFMRDPIEMLTAREREVFELIVSEMTNAQIATRLSISRRTVEIHRARIVSKLGLRNQYQQLLTYAVERGILPK